MFLELFAVCFLAKIKRYKLKYLFYSWTFYPVLAAQLLLIVLQVGVFFDNYYFTRFSFLVAPAIILSFLFPIIVYEIYKPAIIGTCCIALGTVLNKFVIAQNCGKMPVFPSLSLITGYTDLNVIGSVDGIHILGGAATEYKFLTDYIDIGYSILSPGDILIHLYTCIMLFYMIKAVNLHYGRYREKIL